MLSNVKMYLVFKRINQDSLYVMIVLSNLRTIMIYQALLDVKEEAEEDQDMTPVKTMARYKLSGKIIIKIHQR